MAESKGDIQRQRDAQAWFPYAFRVCDAIGHIVSTRTTGAMISGASVCCRCGVEAGPNATKLAAGTTITDPLSLMGGRVA